MGKSIFVRMLFVYLLIILVSFALLGGIFFTTLRNNYLDAQMGIMIDNLHEINEWVNGEGCEEMTDIAFYQRLVDKAEEDDTMLWFISNEKMVYMIADPHSDVLIKEKFTTADVERYFEITQRGDYVKEVSTVENTFEGAVMTVAIPIIVNGKVIGAVAAHRAIVDFGGGISTIERQVFSPLIISMLFAFFLVFVLSRYIVKPIRDISNAAGELSRGNLDYRVKPRTKDELGELAVSFNKMAEELKLQDGLRNTFIANVSHELRTPLASMQGFVQGMLDRAIDEEDRDKYLEIVLGETKRMNALISDLLDLAKVESGKFPIELSEFDINELVRQCIIMFEQRIEDKHLNVKILLSEEKMIVWADRDRISQVITNLVDNAVKFMDNEGELKIWTNSDADKVYVHISDSGEGIPKEDEPYIFERFYKADKSHSRSKPGTGIGLSIVKRIITQHGEKISLTNDPGRGATFTFTLSRSATQEEKRIKSEFERAREEQDEE
jgi:signal transduction histidine kinase